MKLFCLVSDQESIGINKTSLDLPQWCIPGSLVHPLCCLNQRTWAHALLIGCVLSTRYHDRSREAVAPPYFAAAPGESLSNAQKKKKGGDPWSLSLTSWAYLGFCRVLFCEDHLRMSENICKPEEPVEPQILCLPGLPLVCPELPRWEAFCWACENLPLTPLA